MKREELEKKRKYEESLRTRTERGEKIEFEFTPEQLNEIANNTPEGQRLLKEQKERLEREAKKDSGVTSLADKVEDLAVAKKPNEGEEESIEEPNNTGLSFPNEDEEEGTKKNPNDNLPLPFGEKSRGHNDINTQTRLSQDF